MNTWRTHSGFVAWPTLALAALVGIGIATTWALALQGLLPLPLGGLLATVGIYAAFTPMHEAAHGNVGGKKSLAWLDDAVGWSCSLLFLAPFPAFKAVHLRHHSTVNQAGRDPDLWVASAHPLGVVARCLSILPHYYWMFLGPMATDTVRNRRDRAVSVVTLLLQAAIVTALTAAGHGTELLVLWLVPAWLATGLLAFALDWLPHHPHGDTGRFTNARVLLAPGLDVVLFAQNLHLVHHLWPRVPFYRYGTVFRATRHELEAQGAIVHAPFATAAPEVPAP